MASLRASATHAQILQSEQIVGNTWQASEPIGVKKCVSKQCIMYLSFCSKTWPRFCAPVVSSHDVPEELVLFCAIKHITLNLQLMLICSTMCSVLALAVNAHIAVSALLP